MSSVVLTGDTSGAGTITVPAVAGTFTATIGSATGTHYPFTAGTAVASTSGTSIDFTSLPSWVKRITVMFNGVSTNGTSNIQVQLGDAGGVEDTGYISNASGITTAVGTTASTAGFLVMASPVASTTLHGSVIISLVGTNIWVEQGNLAYSTSGTGMSVSGGSKTLSDTLTQIRITTAGGTNTFDAGSINILYE